MKYLIKHKKEFIITIILFLMVIFVLWDGFTNGREVQSVIESIIAIVAWYFNMPTSEENCVATGKMRLEKAQKKGNITGEDFTGGDE